MIFFLIIVVFKNGLFKKPVGLLNVHPKLKNMSYHTHSHAIPNMYFCHPYVEQNRRYLFKNIGGHTRWTQWLIQINNLFLFISVFHRRKECIKFCKQHEGKLWQKFNFRGTVTVTNCNCMILRSVFVCSLRWWLYKARVVIVYSCSRKRQWISHLRGTEFPPWSNSIKY